MDKSMTVRLLSVFLTVLIGFGFPTDCFCSGSGSSQYVSKYLYNLYKKIPVVCWHKEWDERFELEIEASFISPAETMNIYTSKAGISGMILFLRMQISVERNIRLYIIVMAWIIRWIMQLRGIV